MAPANMAVVLADSLAAAVVLADFPAAGAVHPAAAARPGVGKKFTFAAKSIFVLFPVFY